VSISRTKRISVVSSAFSSDARQAAAAAQSAGFDGLQFDAVSPSLDLTSLSQTGRREFGQMLRNSNQQLSGLRSDAGATGLGGGADLDRLLSRWDKAMETAAGLQAPLLSVELGTLPAKETAQADSAIAELGRRADRYGVAVALRSDLSPLSALKRLLTAVACPWFGVDLDTTSLLVDEWSASETFDHLGNLIRHVRARDALLGTDRRTRPMVIGSGTVSWAKLLHWLDEAGFNGWLTIDPTELTDRRGGAVAGLTYLRALWARE
jgi:sugar phosphate isomerase/epimerase